MKIFEFLRPTSFKFCRQIKGNLIHNCDFLKFVISVRGGHCFARYATVYSYSYWLIPVLQSGDTGFRGVHITDLGGEGKTVEIYERKFGKPNYH